MSICADGEETAFIPDVVLSPESLHESEYFDGTGGTVLEGKFKRIGLAAAES
jgi:hypothetical protein